MMIDDYYI